MAKSCAAVAAAALVLLLAADVGSDGGALSRQKRYVVFPEGSTFTVAWCMTLKATTGVDNIWTTGLNWAVSYDLPNETRPGADGFPPDPLLFPLPVAAPARNRRSRRALYSKLQLLMDAAGADGRQCILRALCEAAQRFLPAGQGTMVDEMVRVAFTIPLERVLSWEPPEHREYAHAQKTGFRLRGDGCAQRFSGCPVSLLQLILGDSFR